MEAAESFEVFQPAIVLAVSLCRLGGPVKGHIIANNKRPMAQPNRSSSIHQWPPISPHFLFLDSLTCTAHVWLPKWPKNIFIYGQLVACFCVSVLPRLLVPLFSPVTTTTTVVGPYPLVVHSPEETPICLLRTEMQMESFRSLDSPVDGRTALQLTAN